MRRDQATELRKLVQTAVHDPPPVAWPGSTTGRLPRAPRIAMPRLVAVAGGRSHVGVTTLAVNLAVQWATLGARVVLVEAELERGAAGMLCNVEAAPSILEVLTGKRSLPSCAQRGPAGLRVVPGVWGATLGSEFDDFASQHLCRELQALQRQAEIVVLDIGSAQHAFARRVWQAADDVLLVTTPHDQAVMDAYTHIKAAARDGALREIGLVVNQASSADEAENVFERIARSCRKFLNCQAELRGWLPNDKCCISAAQLRQPLVLRFGESPAAQAIAALAALLANHERPAMLAA